MKVHFAMPDSPAMAACRGRKVNQLSLYEAVPEPTSVPLEVTCGKCKRTPEWIGARASEITASKVEK